MNLIEALKTGRPLRRHGAQHPGTSGDRWLDNEWTKNVLLSGSNLDFYRDYSTSIAALTVDDLFADDWEIQPKQVTVTLKDLAEAWKRALARRRLSFQMEPSVSEIAAELGLMDEEESK